MGLSQKEHSSVTWQLIRENADRVKQLGITTQRALLARQRARHHQQLRFRLKHPEDPNKLLLKSVRLGTGRSVNQFTGGSLVFGFLLFSAGALPWAVPLLYLLFFFVCIPHRILSFHKRKWTFFLVDFCYAANLATVVYLLFFPSNLQVQTLVYALTDGPLAGALIVWQCAWVFGEWDYGVSVLVHLFPGLAVFCQRYYAAPEGLPAMLSSAWCAVRTVLSAQSASELDQLGAVCVGRPQPVVTALGPAWWAGAPLAFYLAWQLLYWLIVQAGGRKFILANGFDTSYNALARRAKKADNIWNKLVRKGSVRRRVLAYGALQGVFTLLTLSLFIPVYHSFVLGLLWQAIKFVVPVYYGSRYQCEKLPKMLLRKALASAAAKTQ